MELEEMIKNYKFTISTYLEYIGLCTDNLLSSQEAQANNKLFRNLTIILSSAFKTYLSTPNLETYIYEPTVNISVPHYSDFKGYKTGAFIIVSFTNKLNRFNAFNKDNTKEKFYYSWLMDLIKIFNREINSLEKIYNSINNNTEFLKWLYQNLKKKQSQFTKWNL